MSGTSLDGISAAVVHLRDDADGRPQATLLGFTHRAYDRIARERLEAAMRQASAQEYCRLNADLGDWLADAALAAMQDAGVSSHQVAAVASHGQTLWHEAGHSTWQIGDASRIAERTHCAVVADFRSRDVAAGGQGAPLVPMADALLFAHQSEWRALQNLGGIGNICIVPPATTHSAGGLERVRAFDTGPGCVIIDSVTRALRPTMSFDIDGALAAAGVVHAQVVATALRHPFFALVPPKSTGRELFTREYVDGFIRSCRDVGATDEDVIATATALTAASIADQCARFMTEPVRELLVSGGGAKNPTLMRALSAALAGSASDGAHTDAFRVPRERPITVRPFDALFFDGEAKEAVAFALLGYLHLTGRSGNLPSATGARGPRRLGAYFPA